jgi:HK97 family phage prohead protease
MSDLLFRAAHQVGVNYPKRIIELVVAPYEEKTLVSDRGVRPVFELFCRGAFDGIQRRPNRIKVNRDHRDERVVGKAIALHPSREEGLVAEVRIAKTELGEETLTLAEEEILDCSAGFRPMADGEEWNRDRTEVRIRRAWLGHIALVPEAAYSGAKVLSVRSGASDALTDASTPNLDLVRAWQLQDQYDRLTRVVAR